MKTFTIENQEHTIPDIKVIGDGHGEFMFEVLEGECAGFKFSLCNLEVDREDEGLLHYNIAAEKDENVEKLETFAGSYILWILNEQVERMLAEKERPPVDL